MQHVSQKLVGGGDIIPSLGQLTPIDLLLHIEPEIENQSELVEHVFQLI